MLSDDSFASDAARGSEESSRDGGASGSAARLPTDFSTLRDEIHKSAREGSCSRSPGNFQDGEGDRCAEAEASGTNSGVLDHDEPSLEREPEKESVSGDTAAELDESKASVEEESSPLGFSGGFSADPTPSHQRAAQGTQRDEEASAGSGSDVIASQSSESSVVEDRQSKSSQNSSERADLGGDSNDTQSPPNRMTITSETVATIIRYGEDSIKSPFKNLPRSSQSSELTVSSAPAHPSSHSQTAITGSGSQTSLIGALELSKDDSATRLGDDESRSSADTRAVRNRDENSGGTVTSGDTVTPGASATAETSCDVAASKHPDTDTTAGGESSSKASFPLTSPWSFCLSLARSPI